jgi:hypothetical protein
MTRIVPGSQNTALYDAIDQARGLAGAIPLQQRAIIAVTDGRDNSSSLTAADIVALANKGEVPAIYTLGIGRDVDGRTLGRLARMSNGMYLQSNDDQGVAAMYRTVRSRLADAYLLHLTAPTIKDAQPYRITWLGPNGARTSVEGVLSIAGSTPDANSSATNRRTLLVLAGVLLLAIAGIILLRKPAENGPSAGSAAAGHSEATGVSESSTPRTHIQPVPSPPGNLGQSGGSFTGGFSWSGASGGGLSGGPGSGGMGAANAAAERGTSVNGGGGGAPRRAAEETEIRRPDSAPILAWLVATGGPMRSREFRIVKPEVVIGRGSDADIRLSDDNRASRHHAKLVQAEPGHFRIVDMASRNGLRVNGQAVTQAELRDADTIEIGGSHLVFKALGSEKN